jgi:hypothetical protein
MLRGDSFTNSAKGAFGRQLLHDSAGISDVTIVSVCRSSGDGGANRRREQQRRPLILAFIPFGHRPERIGLHLWITRSPSCGGLLGLAAALVLKLASIKSHQSSARRS